MPERMKKEAAFFLYKKKTSSIGHFHRSTFNPAIRLAHGEKIYLATAVTAKIVYAEKALNTRLGHHGLLEKE